MIFQDNKNQRKNSNFFSLWDESDANISSFGENSALKKKEIFSKIKLDM